MNHKSTEVNQAKGRRYLQFGGGSGIQGGAGSLRVDSAGLKPSGHRILPASPSQLPRTTSTMRATIILMLCMAVGVTGFLPAPLSARASAGRMTCKTEPSYSAEERTAPPLPLPWDVINHWPLVVAVLLLEMSVMMSS